MHWCRLQDCIALSSAEAELKASCKGLAEALGLREAVEFLTGKSCDLRHFTDASACHSVLKRQGCGTMKHLSVRQLWCQEVMQRPSTDSFKICRTQNPADALCSVSPVESFNRHMTSMRLKAAATAPPPRGGVTEFV